MRPLCLLALALVASFGFAPRALAQDAAPSGPSSFGSGMRQGDVPRALSQLPPAQQAASEAAADDWAPGQPVPPGYRIEHPVQLGFIIPGAATFSLLYLLSAALAYQGDSPVMAAPLVGPLFALNQDHPRTKYGTPALLVLGLGQTVGVGMVAMGFLHRRTTLDSIDEDDLSVGPLWMEHTQGLAVAGRF